MKPDVRIIRDPEDHRWIWITGGRYPKVPKGIRAWLSDAPFNGDFTGDDGWMVRAEHGHELRRRLNAEDWRYEVVTLGEDPVPRHMSECVECGQPYAYGTASNGRRRCVECDLPLHLIPPHTCGPMCRTLRSERVKP